MNSQNFSFSNIWKGSENKIQWKWKALRKDTERPRSLWMGTEEIFLKQYRRRTSENIKHWSTARWLPASFWLSSFLGWFTVKTLNIQGRMHAHSESGLYEVHLIFMKLNYSVLNSSSPLKLHEIIRKTSSKHVPDRHYYYGTFTHTDYLI